MRGQVWLCAFPNLFITIALAEWTFPRPYFLQPYLKCVFAGAYVLALHMFFLVRCVWRFLSSRLGHKYFVVLEYVCKTEYQGIAGGRCIDRIFCGAAFGFPSSGSTSWTRAIRMPRKQQTRIYRIFCSAAFGLPPCRFDMPDMSSKTAEKACTCINGTF